MDKAYWLAAKGAGLHTPWGPPPPPRPHPQTHFWLPVGHTQILQPKLPPSRGSGGPKIRDLGPSSPSLGFFYPDSPLGMGAAPLCDTELRRKQLTVLMRVW